MRDLERRIGAIEGRMPAPPPPPNSEAELAHWLSYLELSLLVSFGEDDPAFQRVAAELMPRAMARRDAGVNMTAIDQEDRAAERVVRVDDPNRPHDPRCKFYVRVAPHPLDADRWLPDDSWYRERFGRLWPLPREMKTALVELLCPYDVGDPRCRCTRTGRLES